MPLLSVHNLRHAFGDRVILDGVSFSLEAGERVGVVGRNGAGKSTFLKALAGLVKFDSGTLTLQRSCRAGYLHQDPALEPTDTLRSAAERAFERLHDLHEQQHALYDEMANATDHDGPEYAALTRRLTKLEEEIAAAGGYAVDHKIEETLHGLGFTDAQFSVPVRGLSGGQKGRLALAKLLLETPDVLLLDEPTNHLDIEGRLWLEHFLKDEFKGAVLLISHDRYLLDNVVTRIVEVEQCRLIDYPGNYEAFREIRAQRRLSMARAFENQQKKFEKEEAYIRRYKAGQRAKQARGRLSKLEREKESSTLERPMEVGSFTLDLPRAERSGDIVCSARGVSKSYPTDDGGRKVLFKGLDLVIARGERWGIIGPNGAGKSTLVRCLLKDLAPDEGVVNVGGNVKAGYYRQTHDGLDLDLSVWRYVQNVILKENPGVAYSEQQARNLAGAFLFSGDEQERDLRTLSGGERSRAVLAGLLASAKNLLVLDEPTNHLDINSAERLEDALSMDGGFDGTMILISHDRALIDATCDHLLVLDGKGNAEVFLGSYTEWHEKAEARKADAARAAADEQRRREEQEKRRRAAEEEKKKQASKAPPAVSTKLSRLSTEKLEAEIMRLESRAKELDALLADPDTYSDHARAEKLTAERTKLTQELEPLEFEWSRRAHE